MADPRFAMGPGYLLCGDPSAATTMKVLLELESFNVSINAREAYAATATSAGAPIAESALTMPPAPTAECEVNDVSLRNLEILLTQMGGTKLVTGTTPNEKVAIGVGGAIERLNLQTWAFIPADQRLLGVSAPDAIWFPRAKPTGLQNLLYNRLREGESQNPVSFTLTAYRGKTDPAGHAIPEGFQYMWFGDPAALGLNYVLPTIEA